MRFVTSVADSARLAHLGTARRTQCARSFTSAYRETDTPPADRSMCRRCVLTAVSVGVVTAEDAVRLLNHRATADRMDFMVELFRSGMKDAAVARRLGISLRSVVRRVGRAMAEVDTSTRFQWAFQLGGRKDAVKPKPSFTSMPMPRRGQRRAVASRGDATCGGHAAAERPPARRVLRRVGYPSESILWRGHGATEGTTTTLEPPNVVRLHKQVLRLCSGGCWS